MLTRRMFLATGLVVTLIAPAQAQEKEIRIGALMAASGPAAFLGASQKNVFEMLVEQINARGGMAGYKVRPFFYDTEGNSTLAVQQFRRLVDSDNVSVAIGPSTTGESLAIRPLANEMKVPLISFAAADAVVVPPTPFVFKVSPTNGIVVEHVLGFMKGKGINSIGLLFSDDGYGQAGAGTVKEVAAKLGLKVAVSEVFGPRDTDMTPQVLKIRSSGADALLIWSVNPGPTIILKNAAALGFNKPIFNSNGAASPQLIEQAGSAAENSYVSTTRLLVPGSLPENDPMRAVVSKLAADYKAKYKVDPDTFIGHPLDALTLIEEAVKKAGSTDREKLAKAMASGIRFPGTNGMYNFTADNHAGLDSSSQSMIMLKIQGGRFVVVE